MSIDENGANKRMGEVRALWGADRAEDSLKWLSELLAADNAPRGIFFIAVKEDGTVDVRSFGKIVRNDVAWAGTMLCYEAHSG